MGYSLWGMTHWKDPDAGRDQGQEEKGMTEDEVAGWHHQLDAHEFDPWVGKISWRRAWQPTPVSLPGESHGQRSLAGCSPWGCRVRQDCRLSTTIFIHSKKKQAQMC